MKRATKRRDAGHDSALDGIGDKNARHILDIIRVIARRGRELSSDDVRDALATPAKHSLRAHPSALAAQMTNACKAHIIRATNRTVPSRRPERRGARIALYRPTRRAS